MLSLVVIGVGASSVGDYFFGVVVFKYQEAVDFQSLGEQPETVGNSCPRLACESFEVAEPIQLGVPLSNFLAPFDKGCSFKEAGGENLVVSLVCIWQLEGECCGGHGGCWVLFS
jgi:hypothetical protein